MKIAIIGAGAIGGLLATRLANIGADITVVARGAQLAAIRAGGLRVIRPDGSEDTASVRAVATCADVGVRDLVFLAVKANQIADIAPSIGTLFGDQTSVVTLQNGLPWWYFQNFAGPHTNYRMRSADPDGVIEANIGARRVIGSVVYPASEVVRPGVIRHVEGDRLPLGELDGSQTPRVAAVSELLTRAGFKAPILPDIRSEIWLKLWGNMSFNPISALTHATLSDICEEPATRELAARMMDEAATIAGKLGATFRVSIEKRLAGAQKVGRHKTSTLQDMEAGRPIEIDALIGSVLELGTLTGVATPTIEAVHALLVLLHKTAQAERARTALIPLAA